ncbi:hypothetical protein [Ponticaulis sp.]|jgi:hypothetical protein|uniref:hypothetical protein n=1 Tax=Ponticaulis sp. TaxID=2020902 RepID=UPI000C355740|nr:hypothetical protein [Ponticaulis sp.]MBN02977.1 hypothetical protein [Ponticaulis sp.]
MHGEEEAQGRKAGGFKSFFVAARKRYGGAFLVFLLMFILLFIAYRTAPSEAGMRREYAGQSVGVVCESSQERYRIVRLFPPVVSRAVECIDSEPGDEEGGRTDGEQAYLTPLSVELSDLLAQQRMAHWTIWIAVFTAVGLVAIFFTLLETNQTARFVTKSYDATRDQLRPLLHIQDASLQVVPHERVEGFKAFGAFEAFGEAVVHVAIVFGNAGETAAKDFSYQIDIEARWGFGEDAGVELVRTFGEDSRFDILPQQPFKVRRSFVYPYSDLFTGSEGRSPKALFALVRMTWRDFDGEQYLALQSYADISALAEGDHNFSFAAFRKF